MTSTRYAIFAAVSTERQAAADKVSLELQETTSRQRANAKGWRETAGPYIIRGETRTIWVNLRSAVGAIPSLRHVLNTDQRHDNNMR